MGCSPVLFHYLYVFIAFLFRCHVAIAFLFVDVELCYFRPVAINSLLYLAQVASPSSSFSSIPLLRHNYHVVRHGMHHRC